MDGYLRKSLYNMNIMDDEMHACIILFALGSWSQSYFSSQFGVGDVSSILQSCGTHSVVLAYGFSLARRDWD